MFQGWENFYLMIGSAAGALIGLLFVVVTLTSGMERDRALRASALYMTPTVVMFSTVLVVGALATAPGLGAQVHGVLIGIMALAGLIYGTRITLTMYERRKESSHWTDFWCYGVAPAALFAGLGVAIALTWVAPAAAADAVAADLIVMLLMGVRNAWDLITWIAPQREALVAATAPKKPEEPA